MLKFLSELSKALLILLKYRRRLYDGILQDVRQRYVGSGFGLAWAFIFPALQLTIYTIVYAFIFRVRPPGLDEMSYVLLVFSGLVPLLAFNEALIAATLSLVSSSSLLLNTVFPADLIPVRAALAAQCPTLIGLIITLIMGFVLGRSGFLTCLMVPLLWILLLMFIIGLGLFLSLITLVVRDIQHAISLVLMSLIILSPFAYTPEMVPSSLRIFVIINPLSYYVLSFQSVICFSKMPDWHLLIVVFFLSCSFFFGGLVFFRRVKNVFFDYV